MPEVVRTKAILVGAQWWIDALPELVADIEQEWQIAVGEPYLGGTEAFVAKAVTADGTPVVLKLLVPQNNAWALQEITVLQLARGEGCAALLRYDAPRGALLLERLGPSLFDLGLRVDQRHEILCAAAMQLWRPCEPGILPSGAIKGRYLIDMIESLFAELNHPCSQASVDYAIACAHRRIVAHDDARAVLCHGDVHQWNVLQSSNGYKLVDPDGLIADAEYDTGIIMREDPLEAMVGDPRDRAHWLASRTGLDPQRIWEWGAVERMSTGLLCVKDGLQPVGDQMLRAAEYAAAFEW